MEKISLEDQIKHVESLWLYWRWQNDSGLYMDAEHPNKSEEIMFYEILQSLKQLKDNKCQ